MVFPESIRRLRKMCATSKDALQALSRNWYCPAIGRTAFQGCSRAEFILENGGVHASRFLLLKNAKIPIFPKLRFDEFLRNVYGQIDNTVPRKLKYKFEKIQVPFLEIQL